MAKIYVGNLSFATSSEDLQELFAQAGVVETVVIVTSEELKLEVDEDLHPFINEHAHKGRFGFVEMPSLGEAKAAVSKFQGVELPSQPGSFLVMSGPHGGDKKP